MKCSVCGRTIKNKSSIARGMGPGCYKKTMLEQKNEKIKGMDDIPGQINMADELRGADNDCN